MNYLKALKGNQKKITWYVYFLKICSYFYVLVMIVHVYWLQLVTAFITYIYLFL